ncbi:MAG: endonuclease [Bacteroidales bacterium]|nr:endonuclease [Bacteroidales bacterium]
MNSKQLFIYFLQLFVLQTVVYSQVQNNLRIGFYNVENFYDVFTDSTREYNAFTPDGDQHWDYDRFQRKRNNIYKTLVALGEGEPPALMGLCEVENEVVLRELIYKTPLNLFNYQYINYPSPDKRGIDVAIIYRTDHLRLFDSKAIAVVDPADTAFKTRDILYASFIVFDTDTIHLFVNHWPSRYGGTLSSNEKRMLAAKTLKKNSDSIIQLFPNARIIIMGDFNDCPNDESLSFGLNTSGKQPATVLNNLVNLFESNTNQDSEGTIKYEHQWQTFDQIIVSERLINAESRIRYKKSSARIFSAPFLLTEDERFLGKKLFRTFQGPAYVGGFSDHLPVYIDLEWKAPYSTTEGN